MNVLRVAAGVALGLLLFIVALDLLPVLVQALHGALDYMETVPPGVLLSWAVALAVGFAGVRLMVWAVNR